MRYERDFYDHYGIPKPFPGDPARQRAYFQGLDDETGETFWSRDLSACTRCRHFRRQAFLRMCVHPSIGCGSEYATAMRRPGSYCGPDATLLWRPIVFWLVDRLHKQTKGSR